MVVDRGHAPKVRDVTQTLGYVTLLVRDYDAAIEFLTGALGFELLEDTALAARREPRRSCAGVDCAS